MSDPLVSIIIPVYNAEEYLKEAIESALQQTWQNKEIILVDDGSTDSSLAIAKQYADNGVRLFSKSNKGASAARNTGLSYAKGQYIQFLDADDLLSVEKLEIQVKTLQNNPGKVAVCSTVHFADKDPHTESSPSKHEEQFLLDSDDPAWFLTNLWGGYGDNGSMIQPNAWLTPRAVIDKAGPWNEALTVDDDGEFFCRVVLNSSGVIKTGGSNYYRRYRDNSLNLSAGKLEVHYMSLFHSLSLRYQHIAKKKPTDALKKAYARSLYSISHSAYPSFSALRRKIADVIKGLNIAVTDQQSLKEKITKRTISILGPELIKFFKSKFYNNPKR